MSGRITIGDVIRQPGPGLDHPAAVTFSPDGAAVTYLWSSEGSLVRSLWRHDLATGERRELAAPGRDSRREEELSQEQRLRRERQRVTGLGVTAYAWSTAEDSQTLLARSGETILVATAPGDELRPVPAAAGGSAAVLSPDGLRLAFVLAGEVWVCDLPDGPSRRLTADATAGVSNGLAEFAAAEELGRHDGLWWSADGCWVAAARVDERGVPPFVISHLSSDDPEMESHHYPFAGGPNAAVGLRILAADGVGEPRPVDLPMAAGDYLARVVTAPRGGWLVAVLSRSQQSLSWVWVEPDGVVRTGWEETAQPWINLDNDTRVLSDGRVLRSTEASGFRHLEIREADGRRERVLTSGPWTVTGVAHVNEASGLVLFTATRDGVTERHLYAVALGGPAPAGDPRRLTAEPGWHEVSISRDGDRWADTWSTLASPPSVAIRRSDGGLLASIHEPGTTPETMGLVVPELRQLVADDGVTPLQVAIYRPHPGHGAPPPAVLSVYGGPQHQAVANNWAVTVVLQRQALCAAGAVVVVVDNRGSAHRGLDFEAAIAGALGRVEVADQAAVIRQLAAEGALDPSRVAISGGSYGGFMTIRCMLREPDLFRAGVAIAPVTAWDGYDTAYTERYLGDPRLNSDAYRTSSLLADAGALRGDLLLVHGELDENVHLRHSLRFLAAVQAAGRPAPPMIILPGQRHRTRGASGLETRERATLGHLARALGLPLPE